MIVQEILQIADAEDSFLVIERLAAMPDPMAAVNLYASAVMDAYWKKKNLNLMVALARAGIQHALTSALLAAASDPERTVQLRSTGKAIAYNLASFTWPGWDEPKIRCDEGHLVVGYEAAKLNLRLAQELHRPAFVQQVETAQKVFLSLL